MRSLLIIPLLVFLLPAINSDQYHREKTYKRSYAGPMLGRQLIQLMRTMHRDAQWRHKNLNTIRFMYENTPFYEMGYLMGEIVERYKKMLPQVRRRFEWKSIFIHDLIRRVQVVQRLYLQVYYLQHMMHEIELKYKDNFEFQSIHEDIDFEEIMQEEHEKKVEMQKMAFKKKIEQDKIRKYKKKQAKREKKWKKYQPGKRVKGMWPIEYGWDIGSDWLTITNPYGL